MVPPRERRTETGASASSGERRFFLAATPEGMSRAAGDRLSAADAGSRPGAASAFARTGRVELDPADAEHARVVLRLSAGDRCIGLDGAGSAWPLAVTASDRRRFEVEIAGAPVREPAPGEPGAPLPRIELAVCLPRGARSEGMVDALVQLGAAALRPLLSQRSPPPARSESARRRERLVRIAREACKQSGRLWELELAEAVDVGALCRDAAGARIVRLDPRAPAGLSAWLSSVDAERWTRARPLVIVVGPEGGFTPEEEAQLDSAGATAASVAPHILRIETAALAALSIVVERAWRS